MAAGRGRPPPPPERRVQALQAGGLLLSGDRGLVLLDLTLQEKAETWDFYVKVSNFSYIQLIQTC